MQKESTIYRREGGLIIDEGSTRHDPSLYRPSRSARKMAGLDAITDDDLECYHRDGYLAVEDAFTPGEVDQALAGMVDLIMGKNPDFDGIVFEASARERLPDLGPDERQDAVRKIMSFVDFDSRLHALAHHPKLISLVTRIIDARPSLFQDMGLIKPPRLGREKPWHQDHAYFAYPIGTKIVGVWIALDEATIENGCMHVLEGGHKEGPRIHFKRRDWQICDDQMLGKQSVSVPLKPGGLLLFDGLLPHGTPHNDSPKRRRALQYHYAAESTVKCEEEERLKIFGSEGKNVTC